MWQAAARSSFSAGVGTMGFGLGLGLGLGLGFGFQPSLLWELRSAGGLGERAEFTGGFSELIVEFCDGNAPWGLAIASFRLNAEDSRVSPFDSSLDKLGTH